MTTRPNCDYIVSIEWMRYQRQWVPCRIFFASPFDNRQVEIRPSLESLQSFSYQDIVKNLKHSHSFMKMDEHWYHILQVPQKELEEFIKVHLLKGYVVFMKVHLVPTYHYMFKCLGKRKRFTHHIHKKIMIQVWNVVQIFSTELVILIGQRMMTFQTEKKIFFKRYLDKRPNAHFQVFIFLITTIREDMSTRRTFYNQYNKHASDRICCPKCHESMTIKQFYRQHASEKHGLDVRKQCVFCFGRRYWDHGQKNRPDNINHIISCLQRFAKDAKDLWAFLDEEDEEMVEETE
ncbi:hypothetical protein TNCV_2053761 [Trichonephila clavipes]|nr:hypothetical protein TNCV_2053761 [Trichonephila clavipes]